MAIEDNHNHFCIYCGSKIEPDQNFCADCGKPVYMEQSIVKNIPSKYDAKINELEQEYDIKQKKARELVEKLFDPGHMAYNRFNSSINKSNELFEVQLGITKKMAELENLDNSIIDDEIKNKLNILETFIDKIEDLINELIIHLTSNKKDDDDINSLFSDMDELIDSVKNY